MKILIVDEEIKLANYVKECLTREGFEVLIATSGEVGLQMMKEASPDLLIVDLYLPDMTGYDIIKTVRENSEVRIMTLTKREEDIYVVRAFEAGADDYVVKPFNMHYLCLKIKAMMKRNGSFTNK